MCGKVERRAEYYTQGGKGPNGLHGGATEEVGWVHRGCGVADMHGSTYFSANTKFVIVGPVVHLYKMYLFQAHMLHCVLA